MDRVCYSCPVAEEGIVCCKDRSEICRKHIAEYEAERSSILAKIKLRTDFVNPPIPVRAWDWSAIDDSTYEPGAPIGWGPTRAAAINALVDEIQDNM